MTRKRQILAGKIAVLLAAPAAIMAFSSGPPAGRTNAPGDAGNCTACHRGTDLNAGGGKVEITFADGTNTYVPGVAKRVQIKVTDAAAQRFGFQASTRLASDASKPAGTLNPTTTDVQVLCANDSLRPTGGCAAANPLEYIEHNAPRAAGSFEFDWVPPATNAGDITIYAAANAANGNGTNTGDHIYATSATLTPQQASGNAPAVNDNGVVNGASFLASGNGGSISAGSWISIFGTDLAASTKDWTGLIDNGVFPTTIDGVQVSVNGKPAAILAVSPTQVNAQVPDDTATGPVAVKVTTANGESTKNADMKQFAPAFFMFDPDSRKYVAAQFPNSGGKAVGRAGLFTGRESEPAEGDQVIEIYGTGFGPTDPARPSGRLAEDAPTLNAVTVRIGDRDAQVQFAGIVDAGLYQLNVKIPSGLTGDQPIVAEVGGVQTQPNAFITLK